MNMIEKVAASLCFADNGHGHEDRRSFYLPMAKAAIAAMREPTEEAIMCGVIAIDAVEADCATNDGVEAAYVAMIDAALSETPDHAP